MNNIITTVNFHHCRDSFGGHNNEWVSDRMTARKLAMLVQLIKSYFPENIGISQSQGMDFIKLYFYTKEDNDFFMILSSNGFEI
jgi:hypothetical protein